MLRSTSKSHAITLVFRYQEESAIQTLLDFILIQSMSVSTEEEFLLPVYNSNYTDNNIKWVKRQYEKVNIF